MSTNSKINTLSIILKRPRVSMRRGKLIAAKTGLTKTLKNPRTAPQKTRIKVEPVKETPAKKRSASQRTIIEEIV